MSCFRCRRIRTLVSVDKDTGIGYCNECIEWKPITTEDKALQFLLETIPFRRGDVVECRTGARHYDGIGVVEEVSFRLQDGGTPVYPSFLVRLTEKSEESIPDSQWYTEICLKKGIQSK